VKKIALVVNTGIPGAVKTSVEVINFLKDKVYLIINQELAKNLNSNITENSIKVIPLNDFYKQDFDLLIAIGGDGTILRTLHKCNKKIFGINAGVVGFLTEVQKEVAVESLEKILNDEYTIDKRVRLKTTLNSKTLEPATNEAVIHTADIAKMRLYQIHVDDVLAQTVRADGIIIATPTGSTSYALSAGGPILDPKVDAFIIVPIAPFKLSARPLVVSSKSTISVKFLGARRKSILVIDGQVEYKLSGEDELNFTNADTPAEFIRFQPDFYKLIEEKLTVQ
jgi:NAD+ kinase